METPNPSSARRRAFLTLGGWTTLLLASMFAVVGVSHLVAERWRDYSDDVPFRGWQVDVTEGGLGALLIGSAGLSAVHLLRRWRALRPLAPYRLAPLLVGIAAGLLLSTVSAEAVTPPVHWASNHTSAAAADRAEVKARLAAGRGAPIPAHSSQPPAPRALAVRLLHTSDLGRGWYDMQVPNTHSLSVAPGVAPPAGQATAAATTLLQGHPNGIVWLPDAVLTESIRRFRTSAQAQAYLDHGWPSEMCACSASPQTWPVRTIDDVRLWQLTPPAGSSGVALPTRAYTGFRVGTDVLTVRLSAFTSQGDSVSTSNVDTTAQLLRLTRVAVRRATPS